MAAFVVFPETSSALSPQLKACLSQALATHVELVPSVEIFPQMEKLVVEVSARRRLLW